MDTRLKRLVASATALLFCLAAWLAYRSSRSEAEPPASSDLNAMLSTPPTGPGVAPAAPAAPVPGSPAPAPRVYVTGAVERPGLYPLPVGARVQDAMDAAGGPSPAADLEAINLADYVKDAEQVKIPERAAALAVSNHPAAAAPRPAPAAAKTTSPGQRRRPSAAPAARLAPAPTEGGHSGGRRPFAAAAETETPPAAAAAGAKTEAPSSGLINVNTAGAQELESLPGIGPAIAQAILEHRRLHGPFARVEDLLNVRGIAEKKLASVRERVTVR